jgi:undecaprenyl-diphosphatase
MGILAAVILAILQGLTEFLPVSSSGHLALGGLLLKIPQDDITFEVVVHLGTLMAVLAVYWKDILKLVTGVLRRERESLLLAGMLALGSVPAAAAGLLLQDRITAMFSDPMLVSLMLIFTGTVLFGTKFLKNGTKDRPGIPGTLLVGISQALALIPGVSRSGMTISSGLLAGIRRDKAARFSFLLSIPAIAGAGVLKLSEASMADTSYAVLVVGFAVSALTGYAALRMLLRFLKAGKFSIFSWYCWLVGLTGFILVMAGV